MALTLDGTASAQAAATVAGFAWLVELDFASGLQRVTTWPQQLVSGGNTYTGLGDLLDVSAISESEDPAADRLVLSLSAANSAMLAAAIGPVTEYRGRAVRVYAQFLGEALQPAGAAVLRFAGYMDKMQIPRTASPVGGGESSGRIEMRCVRAGQARFRNATGLRLTDAQQKQRYPGDRGGEYVATLIEKPAVWLSTRFQQV